MGVTKKFRGSIEKVVADYLRDRLSGRTDIDHRRCILVDTAFSDDLAAIARKVLAEVGGFDEVLETKAGCTIFCHCGTNTLGRGVFAQIIQKNKRTGFRSSCCISRRNYLAAMASISHSTPLGRSLTATQERAGLVVKYRA